MEDLDAAEPRSTPQSAITASSRSLRLLLLGLLGTLLLLLGPVDQIADQDLTLHMFQHIGIFCFSVVFGYGLDRLLITRLLQLKRRAHIVWKVFTSIMIFNARTKGLIFAAIVPSIVFAFWHYPANFDFATTNLVAHLFEHVSYIIAGSLVGLSIVAISRKWRIILLYMGFMQAGMMGSMMLVWPAFFPVYSAAQNVTMDTALMMFGAFGVLGLSSALLKQLDVI